MPKTKRNTVRIPVIGSMLLVALSSPALLPAADLIPPSTPTALIAKTATCGQVDLSWTASTDEAGGSGLKAYIITRNDPGGELFRQVTEIAIGANRTTFSDTNYVRSSATLTYVVAAQDNAGNKSPASNAEIVVTPACATSRYERIIDDSYMEPLGKSIATYGSRTAFVYTKQNASLTLDTWLYIHDENTNQSSRVLLHTFPGYRQVETDYVFTSATELWTLSFCPSSGGKILVSQYALNGPLIPSSATLLSTKSLGDSGSYAKTMIRLKSGALMVAWNQDFTSKPDGTVDAGFAYRSPTGSWAVAFPVNIPNPYGGNITLSQMAMAQHPADGSIWVFDKRDSFQDVTALHLTEVPSGIILDWIKNGFISDVTDGTNGPQIEFPYLSAIADATRNAILLAYQTDQDRIVFVDPLLNDMNSIFLKEATGTIAQIGADGSRTFIPFPNYFERGSQFGFSAAPDGTLWLTYQPINHQAFTWNEVYASNYFSNTWSTPVLVGFNYADYDVASAMRDPGLVIYHTDTPESVFRTPDLRLHAFSLSGAVPSPVDTVPPTTSITSPADGTAVSGVVTVQATASDDKGVAAVDFVVDGVLKGTKLAAPYTFWWDTTIAGKGQHSLQTIAHDIAGNAADSALVLTTVKGTASPMVTITNPLNGSIVPRNTTMAITVAATADVAITKVELYIDNKRVTSLANSPYVYSWKIPAKNASHNINAVAYDTSGKTGSSTVTVTAR